MAIVRDHPYESSSFLVDVGVAPLEGSFCRVELPAATVDDVVYRSGDDPTMAPRHEAGLVGYGHLVLKRGLDGRLDLWQWWRQARDGDRTVDRDVTVTLLDEQRTPVWVWRFQRAFPVAYRVSPLDAGSSDVVVEEVELAFDRLDIE